MVICCLCCWHYSLTALLLFLLLSITALRWMLVEILIRPDNLEITDLIFPYTTRILDFVFLTWKSQIAFTQEFLLRFDFWLLLLSFCLKFFISLWLLRSHIFAFFICIIMNNWFVIFSRIRCVWILMILKFNSWVNNSLRSILLLNLL